jgi:ABC-type hemin transport system substrate-binding protein
VSVNDEAEKLRQAKEWLANGEATTEQSVSAREHVFFVLRNSGKHALRQEAGAIIRELGLRG